MRHLVAGRKLSRTSQHRTALRRNMVSSLFEHGRICTTIEKAKEVKPFAERLITLAKKGDLASRRRAMALLNDRAIFEEKDGVNEKVGTVVGRLFSEIGPKYLDRPGGYTRIVKLSKKRLGDNGSLCYLQLVEEEMEVKEKKAPKAEPKKAAPAPVEEAVEEVVEEAAEEVVEAPAEEEKSE